MRDSLLFSETQTFKQPWIWILFVIIDTIFVGLVIFLINSGQTVPIIAYILMGSSFFLVSGLMVLFLNSRLESQIKENGVYVRFFPFHQKFKYYSWDQINKIYIKEYHSMKEFGGWGLRKNFAGDTAFNVSGNHGLQLEFNDQKKLLIGTQIPEEIKAVLEKINHYRP